MNEDDLRVQRTRRLLQTALVELVDEKGYENVTIRDITQRAQVGYKTFFRHYKSKEGLLQAIFSKVIIEFQGQLVPPDEPDAPILNSKTALQFAREHKPLLLMLIHSPAASQIKQLLIAIGIEEGRRSFGGSDIPDDLVAHFFGNSILSFTQWWLENDEPVEIDKMVEYMDRLLLQVVQNLGSS